jgi:hypothetical protein
MGGTMKSIGWMVAAWLILTGCGEHRGSEPATSQTAYPLDPLTLNGRCATIMRQTRYLDAYTSSPSGNVVTRPQQADDTQRWCFTHMGTEGSPSLAPYFTVQHRSFDGQFLDAYENSSNGYAAVLRDAQQNDSQNWTLLTMGSGFTLRQRSSFRHLTSSTLSSEDYRASTATTSTEWVITPIVDCDPTTISDPRTVTALDPALVTSFASAAAPLYEGALAIQKQVTPGVIDPKRVSVIEGRALDAAGAPAVCAKVTVVGQSSLGTSYVKQDGSFSIALNGGATATVRVEYPGFIPAYRMVTPLPNRFAYASEVRLQAYGSAHPVSATATSTTVVAGASETDAEGTRTAVLLFPSGTTASVAGEASPRTSYSVRVKELTNRDQVGREGMPASLPPQSAFTYAVSLAIDGPRTRQLPSISRSRFMSRISSGFPMVRSPRLVVSTPRRPNGSPKPMAASFASWASPPDKPILTSMPLPAPTTRRRSASRPPSALRSRPAIP